MEDFIKQFRKNLEGRSEPPYDNRDWQDMEKRLDRDGKKPGRPFVWWWAALPIALLLLGSNMLFFLEMHDTNQKLSMLEMRSDTVYTTKVVYVTDTVYLNNTGHTETQTSTAPAKQKGIHKSNWQATIVDFANVFNPTSSLSDQYPRPNSNTVAGYWQLTQNEKYINDENPFNWNKNDIDSIEMLGLDPLEIGQPELTLKDAGPFDKKQRKNLRYYLYSMRPKSYSAGFAGGWIYPITDEIEVSQGFGFGLEGNIWLSANLSIWGNASYTHFQFQSDRIDKTIGVPDLNLSADTYEFIKAEGVQPVLGYALGMQYYFNVQKKWKPFLGMGIGSANLFDYDVIYDIQDKSTQVTLNHEQVVNGRQLNATFALLHVGLEYKMSDHWGLQVRAGYRTHFKESDFHSPKLFNVLTGLNYHF